MSVASRIGSATRQLRQAVSELRFDSPVTHVYNPLDYAARGHQAYLRRYADSRKRVVFLGMNPGPYGMAQTGVPFGEVGWVRDWLGIDVRIAKPAREHPKRPILGFDCPRSEVSGQRLWGAIAGEFERPERFFARHFVVNYCPLVFMEASGRNRTPDKLPADERIPLYAACDRYLRRLIRTLEPEWVVGVGAFAARRAREALNDVDLKIGSVLHPSPANPRANRNWLGEVKTQLRDQRICRS